MLIHFVQCIFSKVLIALAFSPVVIIYKPANSETTLQNITPLNLSFIFYVEINHSSPLFLEGISPGHSEADRQLLEAAKAGDVETVKVRYLLKFVLLFGFYFGIV